jgi:hypothetical protein
LQIAPGDLNIAVVGQLPPPYLSLGDEFEPGPVKMVGSQSALLTLLFDEATVAA